MTNVPAQYKELLSLTTQYLNQERGKSDISKLCCTKELYTFFKEEASKDHSARKTLNKMQTKQTITPPPPPPKIEAIPKLLKLPEKKPPAPTIRKVASKKAAPQATSEVKKGFSLTTLDKNQLDFDDIRDTFSKSNPNISVLEPLKNLENKHDPLSHSGPNVVLMVTQNNAREKLFLQGISLALEKYGAKVSLAKAPNTLFEKDIEKKWILTSGFRKGKIPEVINALVILKDVDAYVQNPLEKRELWNEIKQKILGI